MNSKLRQGEASDRFLALLRAVALIVVLVGAVGSIGLMFHASQHPPPFLLAFFVIWVLSPFVMLGVANVVSKRWSALTRMTLFSVIFVVTLGTLATYGDNALGHRTAHAAFVYVIVPPASWLLIAIALPIAAVISGRLSRRDGGVYRDVQPMRMNLAGRIFKCAAVFAMFGVLAVGALLGTLWLEHRTEITLPTPTGSFPVGRAIYTWSDDAALDTLAPVPGTKRELVVWIWYPSAAGQSVMGDYLPAPSRVAIERARGPLISKLLTRDLSKVHAHSAFNSEVSPQQRSYPVVITRAGASAEVWNYSTLAEDLASYGYVVVGFDAPYRSGVVVFPDGRVITRTPENNPERCLGQEASCANRLVAAWTSDIAFVLDQLARLNNADSTGKFAGRLDMTRVGVIGHSFGGATALQFCHDDSRCTAGIDLDGAPLGKVIREGIHQPFMFLLSDHSRESGPESPKIMANIQSIYDRLPVDGRLRISIRGGNHFIFSDDGALLKSRVMRGVLQVFGKLRIDGRRQLAVTAYCVHSFFDAYLKEARDSPLKISSPLYPEIQVLE